MGLCWEFKSCVDNKWDEIFLFFKTWVNTTCCQMKKGTDDVTFDPCPQAAILTCCRSTPPCATENRGWEPKSDASNTFSQQRDTSTVNMTVRAPNSSATCRTTQSNQIILLILNLWIRATTHVFFFLKKKKRSTISSGPVHLHTDFLQTKPRAVNMKLHRTMGKASTRPASCIFSVTQTHFRKSNSADWQQVMLQFPAARVYIHNNNSQSRTQAPHHKKVELLFTLCLIRENPALTVWCTSVLPCDLHKYVHHS